MSEAAWISTAPQHASNLRPLRADVSDRGHKESELIYDRVTAGEPLNPEDFPKTIYATREAEEGDYRLPNLFRGSGFWIISKAAKEIICDFDLGSGAIYPVDVLKKDKITPVGGDWFCINFGNQKNALVPEQSPRMRHRYIKDGRKGWCPPFVLQDDDIAVSHAALEGPDIWIDPDAGHCFFISDGIAKALKRSKADKGFFLKKCRLV